MRISAKAEYACLAVLALARRREDQPPLRIREISESHAIPERYLVQILLQLKGAGLVVSTRGAAGGYRLARPAELMTLGQVLSAIDGPDLAQREREEGDGPSARSLAAVWAAIRAAERSVLDSTSIAQLAAPPSPPDWVI
ncbi:Rrf2 family transcriptional regulator [Isosphaeraceae bacterium EP7]